MAGTKTIYVRDEDLWDRAKALAGEDGLSGAISHLLSEWVEKQEAARRQNMGELSEVELWVGGKGHEDEHAREYSHHVAFAGRQIAESDGLTVEQSPRIRVYQTKTGKLIVYRDWRDTAKELGATYRRYPDVAALKRDPMALRTQWSDDTKDFDERTDLEDRLLRQLADALGEKFVIRID